MTIDIKDFYLNSHLKEYEYIYIDLDLIPQDFIDKYNLEDIAKNGKVLTEVCKGMYGLKQAGKLAHEDLKLHLASHRYKPIKFTLWLWRHELSRLTFTLIVDDFRVKYTNTV